jgi:hypothetical protein
MEADFKITDRLSRQARPGIRYAASAAAVTPRTQQQGREVTSGIVIAL